MKSVLFTKYLSTSSLSNISLSLGKFKVLLNPPKDLWGKELMSLVRNALQTLCSCRPQHKGDFILENSQLKAWEQSSKNFLQVYCLLHSKCCISSILMRNTHTSFRMRSGCETVRNYKLFLVKQQQFSEVGGYNGALNLNSAPKGVCMSVCALARQGRKDTTFRN